MTSFSSASSAKVSSTPVFARLGVSWFRKMRFPAKAGVILLFLIGLENGATSVFVMDAEGRQIAVVVAVEQLATADAGKHQCEIWPIFRADPGASLCFYCRSKLGFIRIRFGTDLADAGNTRLGAAGVVKEGKIANLHRIAHEIARLIVAHAEPGHSLRRGQIIDRHLVRFGLHQPVLHFSILQMETGGR